MLSDTISYVSYNMPLQTLGSYHPTIGTNIPEKLIYQVYFYLCHILLASWTVSNDGECGFSQVERTEPYTACFGDMSVNVVSLGAAFVLIVINTRAKLRRKYLHIGLQDITLKGNFCFLNSHEVLYHHEQCFGCRMLSAQQEYL
jgi:hypothetical protein